VSVAVTGEPSAELEAAAASMAGAARLAARHTWEKTFAQELSDLERLPGQ